jgi:hypothetical protein
MKIRIKISQKNAVILNMPETGCGMDLANYRRME